jgi:hypothetical protein
MRFRTIAKVAIISLSIWQAASAQSGKETSTRVLRASASRNSATITSFQMAQRECLFGLEQESQVG